MREIKFRVWCGNEKKFLNPDQFSITGDGNILEWDWHSDYGKSWGSTMRPEVIIQQYTGIKDKNDKEIYDGDLVSLINPLIPLHNKFKSRYTIHLVDFNSENFRHVYGWNLLDYGSMDNGIFMEEEMETWESIKKIYYPPSKYYYGSSPNQDYIICGNIFEGVIK